MRRRRVAETGLLTAGSRSLHEVARDVIASGLRDCAREVDSIGIGRHLRDVAAIVCGLNVGTPVIAAASLDAIIPRVVFAAAAGFKPLFRGMGVRGRIVHHHIWRINQRLAVVLIFRA